MAGTRKTSISLTVADALNTGQPFTDSLDPPHDTFLGASFFFKQGDTTRNSTKNFFTTIARRLAQVFADFVPLAADAVSSNWAIGSKAPQQQLSELIVKPLSILDIYTFLPIRLVIVVDALNECINKQEVDELLGMLVALGDFHQVQLRILITSRGDEYIFKSFEKLPDSLYHSLVLDKIRPPVKRDGEVDDITLYLTHTLSAIAARHGVSSDWIDEGDIIKLSRKADVLFIYAATACRFLDADDFTDEETRQELLDQIFEDDMETDTPQQKVDEIYTKVLSFPHLKLSQRARTRVFERIRHILGFVVVVSSLFPLRHSASCLRLIRRS